MKILYRGKRLDTGNWVRGFFVHLSDGEGRSSDRIYTGFAESDCGEFYPDFFEVDPNTVGQYIGIDDVHGEPIFEGDHVMVCDSRRQGLPAPVKYSKDECAFVLARRGYNPINFSDDVKYKVVGRE